MKINENNLRRIIREEINAMRQGGRRQIQGLYITLGYGMEFNSMKPSSRPVKNNMFPPGTNYNHSTSEGVIVVGDPVFAQRIYRHYVRYTRGEGSLKLVYRLIDEFLFKYFDTSLYEFFESFEDMDQDTLGAIRRTTSDYEDTYKRDPDSGDILPNKDYLD